MGKSLKHIGFLVSGCALGFGVLYLFRGEISVPTALTQTKHSQERGAALATLACIPQGEDGDIFFVTCGGIY